MRAVQDQRITVLPGPPTIYQTLLDHPRRGDYDLTSLRFAVTGAAVVPVVLIERMQNELDIDIVLTAYGLTEASGFGTMCRADDDAVTVATTCGRPIADFELRIDGDERRAKCCCAVPTSCSATSTTPRPPPPPIDADGWLHTGDVGTLDAAGNLSITDRLKDMYICGGFNVYPAEIEQVLARLDGVADSAVIGVPDERLGEVGKAFVVVKAGRHLDEAAVIAHTREHLANFKTPRSVVFVDVLPRNPGGKVVKPLLREIDLMDLTFDDETEDFRAEVRDFLAANTEHFPTVSYDLAEGFEQHRHWDKVLFDAGLSVIAWPKEYGGRDATLLQWIVYEEEYFRAGAPGRASANGTSMLGPTLFAHGTEEQRDAHPAQDGQRRGDLGAGVVGARVGQRPRLAALDRDQDRRRLEAQRPEDLELASTVRRQGIRTVPLGSDCATPQGSDLRHVRPARRRRHRAADRPTGRRHRLRRDLPRRRVRARRRRHRRAWTTGWRAAMSTSSNERGMSLRSPARFLAPAERLVEAWQSRPQPGVSPTGSPTPGSRRRPTACTRSAPSPGWPAAANSAPSRR